MREFLIFFPILYQLNFWSSFIVLNFLNFVYFPSSIMLPFKSKWMKNLKFNFFINFQLICNYLLIFHLLMKNHHIRILNFKFYYQFTACFTINRAIIYHFILFIFLTFYIIKYKLHHLHISLFNLLLIISKFDFIMIHLNISLSNLHFSFLKSYFIIIHLHIFLLNLHFSLLKFYFIIIHHLFFS